MSFWFDPQRTDPELRGNDDEEEYDLHPTDVEVFHEYKLIEWANGSWLDKEKCTWGWGTKSDGYVLGILIGPSFKNYINKWAPPKVVEGWGERLEEMARGHVLENEKYWLRYGKFLTAMGRRGIGLVLSW